MRIAMVLVIVALCGCAELQNKPALRTALIAAGSAVLVGTYYHQRENAEPPEIQKIPREPCKHDRHECE